MRREMRLRGEPRRREKSAETARADVTRTALQIRFTRSTFKWDYSIWPKL